MLRFPTWDPQAVRANKSTWKEMSAEKSKRDQLMMGPGKTLWETRNPDTALRNPMQALRFSTANVGTLVGFGAEVVDMLSRRKVDVARLQEVRNKIVGTKIVSERRGCGLQIIQEW